MALVHNIYKIEKQHHLIKNVTDTDKIIKVIIREAYAKANWKLEKQDLELDKFSKDGFTYYLYLHRINDKTSEWASFLPKELISSTERFNQTKISLVLFIETKHALYATAGGNSFTILVNFIDDQFGLSIYDKIISPENDEAIATKSRRIIGQQIGMNEQFRDQYKIINYLQFGKIPKELNVKLSGVTCNLHFGFLQKKIDDRINISAGKAFRIGKELDFEHLHQVISELETIDLELAPQNFLSSYVQIKDPKLEENLQLELNHRIYNYIAVLNGTSNSLKDKFEFDFCNPNNLQAFYEAETYQLKHKEEDKHVLFDTVTDKNEIFRKVILKAYEIHGNNETSILYFLRGVRILCYRGTRMLTSSGFLYHINTEFIYNGEGVFYIDTNWYRLKDSFLESLNKQTQLILNSARLPDNILSITWDKKANSKHLIDEGEYNMKYNGLLNYFVVDTITPDGVEICDIIFIDDSNLYVIHVKQGFSATVRELTNQILISARRVHEARAGNNKQFFEKVYNSLTSKGRNINNFSKDEFVDLFLKRNIVYVLATVSQFEDDAVIEENLDRYSSNIARFSLTTCASEVRTAYSDLKVAQIRRTQY